MLKKLDLLKMELSLTCCFSIGDNLTMSMDIDKINNLIGLPYHA